MSITALAWAFTLKLPPRDKFVLVALCDHYNDDKGRAWMSQGRLASYTGYTRSTVNAALKSLEYEHGLIESASRRYEDGGTAPKDYYVHVGMAPASGLIPEAEAQLARRKRKRDSVRETGRGVRETDRGGVQETDRGGVRETDRGGVRETDRGGVQETDNNNSYIRTLNEEHLTGERDSQSQKESKARAWDASLVDLPECVDRQQWVDFVEHRRKKKSPVTELAAARLLKRLAAHPEHANQMLDDAIANGWTGVFPPRATQHTPAAPPAPEHRTNPKRFRVNDSVYRPDTRQNEFIDELLEPMKARMSNGEVWDLRGCERWTN